LVPKDLLGEVQRRFAPPLPPPAARPAEPPLRPGRRLSGKESKDARELREAKLRDLKEEPRFGSVLSTTLDIEEPPLDTQGPSVVLVSR
jgi:hypothetical protein